MANRELKALKKQLLALQNERDKEKEYIKAKDGLFEINFKTDILKITKAGKGGIKNESES